MSAEYGSMWLALTVILSMLGHVTSHGRMIQPAQRSSAWRFGYDNPINYNDNELFCGGFGVQWNAVNDGRCGVCGDAYSDTVKPNEDINGAYVENGVITGNYIKGDVMTTKIDLTAYHKGWFEFRLCPLATTTTKVTQACLNNTQLQVAGSNTSRISLNDIKHGNGVQVYEIDLQLPTNITCNRCVLQWRYNTGNSNGCDSTGCCVGCGKQENFVNCADIQIVDGQTGSVSTSTSSSSSSQSATMTALKSSTLSTTSSTTSSTSTTTTESPKTATRPETTSISKTTTLETTTISTTTVPSTTNANFNTNVWCSSTLTCSAAVGLYFMVPGMASWCCDNCKRGFCPSSRCVCNSD